MSLRSALLALISAGPLTGYDAAKQFRGSVGHLWHAPDSQIYPELRKMQTAGLLDATEVPWGKKLATKTQYSITAAGREALAEWQQTPLKYAAERDQAHLLAAYFEWAPDDSPRARLEEHIAHFMLEKLTAERQAAEIQDGSSPLLQQRLSVTAPDTHCRVIAFKLFAYEGKITRAESEIAWARRGLDLLDTLADPPLADSADEGQP